MSKMISPWQNIDRMFNRARRAIGMEGLWFHDMRRYAEGRIMPNTPRRSVEMSWLEAA